MGRFTRQQSRHLQARMERLFALLYHFIPTYSRVMKQHLEKKGITEYTFSSIYIFLILAFIVFMVCYQDLFPHLWTNLLLRWTDQHLSVQHSGTVPQTLLPWRGREKNKERKEKDRQAGSQGKASERWGKSDLSELGNKPTDPRERGHKAKG